jgi:hypothetical protein
MARGDFSVRTIQEHHQQLPKRQPLAGARR